MSTFLLVSSMICGLLITILCYAYLAVMELRKISRAIYWLRANPSFKPTDMNPDEHSGSEGTGEKW